MIKLIFDLDGTVTRQETLPLMAEHFGVQTEIQKLTAQTIQGYVPFIESFIKRVHILGNLPINEVSDLLENVLLYDKIISFIKSHPDNCVIATGNLDCWVDKLCAKIGCEYHCSHCIVEDNKVLKLTHILRKEDLVEKYKSQGYKVVFIGDGNNDVEAMRIADISIGAGLTHMPSQNILSIADYVIFNEDALCRQLNQLL
jgi:HAD superfamily phosphoserine phosphatase-like hydrolase